MAKKGWTATQSTINVELMVHQEFLDSLRPGEPRYRMGQRTMQPPVSRKGNKISSHPCCLK